METITGWTSSRLRPEAPHNKYHNTHTHTHTHTGSWMADIWTWGMGRGSARSWPEQDELYMHLTHRV